MALYWHVFALLTCGSYYSNGLDHKRTSNSSSFTSSWAIRIPMVHYSNITELHALADLIADEAGLVNRGQIGGLLGHYLYIHNTFFNQSGIKRHELGKVQSTITEHLANHPEIEWSRQEVVRMRYRRSLQFKDQYFPSQWHLVRVNFLIINLFIEIDLEYLELKFSASEIFLCLFEFFNLKLAADPLVEFKFENSWS